MSYTTIPDPGLECAIFTDSGRVFYDMTALVAQIALHAEPMIASFDESTPDSHRYQMVGTVEVARFIEMSRETLLLDYQITL